MEKRHREEANVKRQIAALLMGAALCAVMPAAAENMRIGDQAVVTKEKEDAVLRTEANDAADELVHVSAGQSVIYIAPEKGGYAQVEAAGVRGYLPADRLESQTTRGTPFSITEEERLKATRRNQFTVEVVDGVYVVKADWLANALAGVNMEDYESLQYFQRVLIQSGIIKKLEEMGVQEGDTVSILDFEFEYVK